MDTDWLTSQEEREREKERLPFHYYIERSNLRNNCLDKPQNQSIDTNWFMCMLKGIQCSARAQAQETRTVNKCCNKLNGT